jgi:hypothetical protein
MFEKVEWRVTWEDEHGVWHNAQDGAQSMFGLTAAQKLVQKLGPPWQVRHRTSMLTPAEHEALDAQSEHR